MSNLKKKIRKALRTEIADKTMNSLVGLNEKHEVMIQCMAESASKKIVNAYYSAIKIQHRKAVKGKHDLLPLTRPEIHAGFEAIAS